MQRGFVQDIVCAVRNQPRTKCFVCLIACSFRDRAMCLWGALRDGACCKAQLVLRLLRTLPQQVAAPLPRATWMLLVGVAASMLNCRYESLFHEGLKLLLMLLERILPDFEPPDSSALNRRGLPSSRVSLNGSGGAEPTVPYPFKSFEEGAKVAGAQEQLEYLSVILRHSIDAAVRPRLRVVVGSPRFSDSSSLSTPRESAMMGDVASANDEQAAVRERTLDELITALMLKGATVGSEIGDECRACCLQAYPATA